MNTEERKRLRKEYSKLTNAERAELIDAIPVLLDEVDRLEADNAALRARVAELESRINTPHTSDFLEAVRLEAAHQLERWPDSHDAQKSDADWFWLIGWLAAKAVHAPSQEKRLHHIITTAAAAMNWHARASAHPLPISDVETLRSRIEKLEKVREAAAESLSWIRSTSQWRKRCQEFDADMDNPIRDFNDEEEWDRLEAQASAQDNALRSALDKAGEK